MLRKHLAALSHYPQLFHTPHFRQIHSSKECDFTHFFAASELINLPQKSSFEHEVKNENLEVLPPLAL